MTDLSTMTDVVSHHMMAVEGKVDPGEVGADDHGGDAEVVHPAGEDARQAREPRKKGSRISFSVVTRGLCEQ